MVSLLPALTLQATPQRAITGTYAFAFPVDAVYKQPSSKHKLGSGARENGTCRRAGGGRVR